MYDYRSFLDFSVTLRGLAEAYFCVSMFIVCGLLATLPFTIAQTLGETHNARGGYIEACGDLPGLVGDDC